MAQRRRKHIAFGDQGAKVIALQKRLNRWSAKKNRRGDHEVDPHVPDGQNAKVFCRKLKVDGDYGPSTFDMVRFYEIRTGRNPVDGKVTRGIWTALRIGIALNRIIRRRKARFEYITADKWGRRAHGPYQYHSPVGRIFTHTSVTAQLSPNASKAEEMSQMRSLDNIGFGREFNGISYNHCVFPSGRVYEGRGFLVTEAASAPYNSTSDSVVFVGNTDLHPVTKDQFDGHAGVIKMGIRLGKYTRPIDNDLHNEIAPKACPGRHYGQAQATAMEGRVN